MERISRLYLVEEPGEEQEWEQQEQEQGHMVVNKQVRVGCIQEPDSIPELGEQLVTGKSRDLEEVVRSVLHIRILALRMPI